MEAGGLNEWLKLMLDEIRRKQRERDEAQRERARRAGDKTGAGPPPRDPAGKS